MRINIFTVCSAIVARVLILTSADRYLTVLGALLIAGLATTSRPATAVEQVIALPNADVRDIRDEYNSELLHAVMDATVEAFGPYELISPKRPMLSHRMIVELSRGDHLNVVVSTYKSSWEGQVLVVPFPVNKGLASYRVFFAPQKISEPLARINKLEQLKSFRFGQGRGWSTAKILEDHGFRVVYADSYTSLSRMLAADRFDLFMRGVHEMTLEKPTYLSPDSSLMAVDSFALYTYLPAYFQVTKKRPILAQRLEAGLKKLDRAGSIEAQLKRYYGEAIELASNTHRKVFYLKNTNLKPGMYERDKPYLLDANLR